MIYILLIDHDKDDAKSVSQILPSKEFTVDHSSTLSQGLIKLSQERFDVVILDSTLPGSSNLDSLESVIDSFPSVPVVILTENDNDRNQGIDAVRLGAQDYLFKSDLRDGRMLARILRDAIERNSMMMDLEDKSARLSSSRTLFSSIISQNADGVLVLNTGGIVKYANLAALKMFGKTREEIVGEPFAYPFGDTTVYKSILCDKERSIYVDMRVTQIIYDGSPMYIVSLRDVTTKRELEDVLSLKSELERERNRLNMMFETAAEGIVVMDKDANIIETNGAFKRILNASTLGNVKGNFFDFVDSADKRAVHSRFNQCFQEGWICDFRRFHMLRSDGTKVPCILNTSLLRFNTDEPRLIVFVTDITDQVETEERLIRSETLAVVGTLAAGVAHEFNNILAVIRGHLDSLLLQPHAVSRQVRSQLEIMLRMVERGSEITNNLMLFTRESSNGHKCVEMNEMVDECVKLVFKEFQAEGIWVEVDVPNGVVAFANPSQIGQVVMNLLLNAKDAMLDRLVKHIVIRGSVDDDNCWLDISDTGCGIDPENLRHIFNPFFSTKGEKALEGSPQMHLRGTGLGLAVCHTIMTKHHLGDIIVESRVGVGTTFKLRIPKYKSQKIHEEAESIQDVPLGRGESVLVLDDEAELASIIGKVLTEGGYEVMVTDDGHEALRHHVEKPFDVVLMDLKMPIMSGYTFLHGLKESPDTLPKIIVATGNPSLLRGNKEQMGVDEVLIKPLSVKDIFQCIRCMLDGPSLPSSSDSERGNNYADHYNKKL